MLLSKDGDRFLILIVMLFTQITLRSSEETCLSPNISCKIQEVHFRLDTVIEFANKAKESLKAMKLKCCPSKPDDCSILRGCGKKSSGIYTIWPKNRLLENNSIEVYCDMETEGGGWTVIQRRGDFGNGEDYFYRDWAAYKQGFGRLSEDFWIGNDNIFAITNQKKYCIRFDLKDLEGEMRWAEYNDFWIGPEDCNYTLHVGEYKGNAGDCFSYHSEYPFSTKDRDNDGRPFSCAVVCRGAWWYKACYQSNLNALYLNGYHPERRYQGINWVKWKYENYSLPFTEMKIRPLLHAEEISPEQCVFPSS